MTPRHEIGAQNYTGCRKKMPLQYLIWQPNAYQLNCVLKLIRGGGGFFGTPCIVPPIAVKHQHGVLCS